MDPLRLLGLIGMWEGMGDGWYHQRHEDIWDQLTDIGFAEDDFRSWDDNAFQQLTTELRLLFDAMGKDLPKPVTRAALAQIIKLWSEGEELKKRGEAVPEEYLPHITPLGWEHINLHSAIQLYSSVCPLSGQPSPAASCLRKKSKRRVNAHKHRRLCVREPEWLAPVFRHLPVHSSALASFVVLANEPESVC